jgi:hypothetical protein
MWVKACTFDLVKFPKVLIFLKARAPGGPTKGSSADAKGLLRNN